MDWSRCTFLSCRPLKSSHTIACDYLWLSLVGGHINASERERKLTKQDCCVNHSVHPLRTTQPQLPARACMLSHIWRSWNPHGLQPRAPHIGFSDSKITGVVVPYLLQGIFLLRINSVSPCLYIAGEFFTHCSIQETSIYIRMSKSWIKKDELPWNTGVHVSLDTNLHGISPGVGLLGHVVILG